MLNRLLLFWTKSPVALRSNHIILVWFGVIVGGVVALAIPTILHYAYRIDDPRYVQFFFSFFTWWPLFSILGAIFLFHDFWFSLGTAVRKMLSGQQHTWRRPGAVFYGGFLGSLILIILLGIRYRLSFLYALDFLFAIIPFFHGLSRLACLNFGCCYGKECTSVFPLKVQYFHPDSEPVRHGISRGMTLHPVQVYEMLCCFLIGCLMVYLIGKAGEGKVFAYYLICYGAARFLLEFVRDNTHEKAFLHIMSVWQLLSLCFIAVGVVLLYLLPNPAPLLLRNAPSYTDGAKITLLALWNACCLGLTFGIHFRERNEPL